MEEAETAVKLGLEGWGAGFSRVSMWAGGQSSERSAGRVQQKLASNTRQASGCRAQVRDSHFLWDGGKTFFSDENLNITPALA